MMVKLILSCLSLIAIAVLVGFSTVVHASPYGAGKYNANVPYGGQTQLSISTNGNRSFSIVPDSSGVQATVTGTVTVVSTDVVGYKLYIRALTVTTMAHTAGGATIAASANGSPAALATNTWGYSLDAGATFSGITASDVLIRSATQPYSAGDVTNLTYGAKIDNTKKPGSYAVSIVFTAVPQTN